MEESDEQDANADSSIRESLEPKSNVTVDRLLHPEKHFRSSVSTQERMLIEISDEQSANAKAVIAAMLQPSSNATVETIGLPAKQPTPR
jgi:hypothetical protein